MTSYDIKELRRINYIDILRDEAFGYVSGQAWTFENASVMTKSLQKIKKYAEEWNSVSREGIGLLLIGDVGTGKSYAAGCVANELLDHMISVRFVRMADVVNDLQGCYGEDREKYYKHIMSPALLIIDDLGAERDTAFAQECVFEVIEHRISTGKPIIITTNIPVHTMRNAKHIAERRIYDRILACCVPILFDGVNFRKNIAAEKTKKAKQLFDMDTHIE